MKKTLIALAVAASAVSGMAHAWTNGDFNGSVDIGGSITADDYRQKWSWAVGSDINGFSNALTDLTEGGTKLTITVNSDKPILLGKTNEAFAAPTRSGVGAIPHIKLTDSDGNTVAFQPGSDQHQGMGYFVLPLKEKDTQSKIGTIKVNTTYAGVAAVANQTEGHMTSLYGRDYAIFYGGLANGYSEVSKGSDAANITGHFGSLSNTDMLTQIQKVHSGVTELSSRDSSGTENMYYGDGSVVSAAYAMGIANGQTLEATFDQAVTKSTQWSAPLNVAVTYN